ncbi:MAG: LutB/LldF family L-lactate oxidation iron-sulfur protein [Chloroflexota bacterium]
MRVDLPTFRAHTRAALADQLLQQSIENASGNFSDGREKALGDLPDSEALRDQLKLIRAATLANLTEHLEEFERNATAAGVVVHWAQDASEACEIVIALAKERGISQVVKTKSMVSEEIQLNSALEGAGIRPVETDLGEWIVQLAAEPPSHIIAPAVHKTKEQVADLFSDELGRSVEADIAALTAAARDALRGDFLSAQMGITGGNILVAESGTLVLVTNEGNGRMVTSLPPVHVAVVGIEKVVPSWEQAEVWLSLLSRSATGQPLSIYTNLITGPARPGELDGPQEVHLVLLDNQRSSYLGTQFEEMFGCIRCGACLNVCPVYTKVGGHAYRSPYSGPMGAVLTPLLFGKGQFSALPQASTLCGACLDVCPVRIDLPRMLLQLREEQVEAGRLPWLGVWVERAAAWVMTKPKLYRMLSLLARKFGGTRLAKLFIPFPIPEISQQTFHQLWKSRELEE